VSYATPSKDQLLIDAHIEYQLLIRLYQLLSTTFMMIRLQNTNALIEPHQKLYSHAMPLFQHLYD